MFDDVSRPCLGEHVKPLVPILMSQVSAVKYTEYQFSLPIQFVLRRFAEVQCQSLRGKNDIQIKPVNDLVLEITIMILFSSFRGKT